MSIGIEANFYLGRPITAPGDLLAESVDALAGCPLVLPNLYDLGISRVVHTGTAVNYEPVYGVPGSHPVPVITRAIRAFQHGQPLALDQAGLNAAERAREQQAHTPEFGHKISGIEPASLQWSIALAYHGDGNPLGPMERILNLYLYVVGDTYEGNSYERQRFGSHRVANMCASWHRREPYTGMHDVIAEHLDALTTVLTTLVGRLRPFRMEVAIEDGGLVLPLDAGLVYYRDLAAVVDDMRMLGHFWQHGHGAGHPPLRQSGYRELMTHRTDQEARHLWRELEETMPFADRVTAGDVQAAMESGRQDWYQVPSGGQMVLHYPYFLNETVADFYVDVLRQAMARI